MVRLFLLLALLVVFGCGSPEKTVAPLKANTVNTFQGLTLEQVQTPDGPKLAWVSRDAAHRVTVKYICDYPNGYAGPPAPGHCYEDGTGCTGPSLDYTNPYTVRAIGDPDSPDKGDPDTSQKARSIGDPTADDAADPDGSVVR